ncbi:MAG: hypoxanthine phosphoribosyltransferase [Deltaproteobacteria bacterium]|uniref:Hypoxanthine phosphoribosyltransferase n=1 Tax=Candidatus Zymogenus saltonus TaxID=2844893 RepID=A0A9D8PPB2_9DELT|nr:hypoxanthine phosphoribosyltransferase [Candidatus Zymogenus saltonus]
MARKKLLFSKDDINDAVSSIAKRISKDYKGGRLMMVCVLKGAFVFMSDLIRMIEGVDIFVDFVILSSYGSATTTSGEIKVLKDLDSPIEGKDVLIIEDIVDTGITLKFFKDQLLRRRPKSVKICALLDKKSRREVEIELDYAGLSMQDGFVVGYGIDCDESYRNLPEIWVLMED